MNESLLQLGLNLTEQGWIPAPLIRWGIRRICRQRLEMYSPLDCESEMQQMEDFIHRMKQSPIAPVPEKANEQHYELPPEFFALVLGPHRKYSSCLWKDGTEELADAEAAALEETCRRADLRDGQNILELGCGWGSLSLWMAQHYTRSRITAVSNSADQRLYIEQEAARRGIRNLRLITADMNQFEAPERFDRVVSVEMFEHMRNLELLLERIAGWLRPGGKLFIHIFVHCRYAYEYETSGADNWMGRYFFTGGMMPSDGLLHRFQKHLMLTHRWRWSGQHYEKTSNAWLKNLEQRRNAVLPILEKAYGTQEAIRWYHRWRVFFMACAELFGYQKGQQWWVAHYVFEKTGGGKGE